MCILVETFALEKGHSLKRSNSNELFLVPPATKRMRKDRSGIRLSPRRTKSKFCRYFSAVLSGHLEIMTEIIIRWQPGDFPRD